MPDGELKPLGGIAFEGYEIHMGVTTLKGSAKPFTTLTARTGERIEEKEDGAVHGNVMGTYTHGIFDEGGLAGEIVRLLAERKGISSGQIGSMDTKAFKDSQYDLLAAGMREHMDIGLVYKIMGM